MACTWLVAGNMIHPGLRQEAERIPAGMIWLVGLAGVTVSALLVAIAWWLVGPG